MGALLRPRAWPSFVLEVTEISNILGGFNNWSLMVEEASMNKEAFLIVQSAVRDDRWHSYVAVGCPSWLEELFEQERSLASV